MEGRLGNLEAHLGTQQKVIAGLEKTIDERLTKIEEMLMEILGVGTKPANGVPIIASPRLASPMPASPLE